MTFKKSKPLILILILIILLAVAAITTKCSLDKNGNWVYRDFKSRMRDVPYGEAISKIDIYLNKSIIAFDITLKPDNLTRIETYKLGRNIVNEIENEYLKDESLKGASYLSVYPISGRINEDFYYRRPTSERRWCFTGDLGDGQEYSGAYLDEMPDFGD